MRVIAPSFLCVLACSTQAPAPAQMGSGDSASAPAPPTDVATARIVELVDAGAGAMAGPPAPPVDAAVKVPSSVAGRPPSRAPDLDGRLEEEARRMAELLTSEGPSGTSLDKDMSRRRPGADLGTLADLNDRSVAIGGGGGRGTRVGGAGSIGSKPSDSKSSDSKMTGRVSVTSKQALDDTTLTADVVLRKVQMAYMAGIKRCYKQLLATSPQARGRLGIELTVDATGRATRPSVKGFDASLDTCVSGLVATWRFPVPKDADGESTDAVFTFSLQLTPD